jgi:hypothetical protein
MSFFGKLGGLLKKVAAPVISLVPGGNLALQAYGAVRSAGEDRRKLELAKKANLRTGPKLPATALARDVIKAPAKLKAPKISLAGIGAEKKRTAIRADQVLKLKAGAISPDRQKLAYDEWKMLGSPGTWEEYLLDQVRTGAIS